jgi:predicted RNase H-like HicB family nuclease
MVHYVALLHKDTDSDIGVSFPDLPGCISAGSTLEEALSMAEEALAGHFEAMADHGLEIPAPSSLDAVMADPENRDGIAVLVPAPEPDRRAVRVNITLPERLLRRIDERTGNRSRFLAEAAERALAEAGGAARRSARRR